MKKVLKIMDTVFGWGAMLALCLGGLTVVGFVIALIIGGETGGLISVFLYKKVFNALICFTSVLMLFGLLRMYLSKQKELTVNSNAKKSPDEAES